MGERLLRAHSAPVASHFAVSSWRPVYLPKRCSFLSCILKFCRVPVVMLTSSTYQRSSYVMIAVVLLWVWYVGQYPRLPTASHLRRGSMNIVNRGSHVVCVRHFVELFTCVDVWVLEAILFHYLEQDAVVHSSGCAFEVWVSGVYVFFLIFWHLRTWLCVSICYRICSCGIWSHMLCR